MTARVVEIMEQLAVDIAAIRALLEKHEERGEPSKQDLLGPSDLARALGVDGRTLRRLRAANQAPRSIQVGGRPRWRRAAVEAWLANRKAGQ